MNQITIRNKIIIKQFIKFLKMNYALDSYIFNLHKEEKKHIMTQEDLIYSLIFSRFTPYNDNLFKKIRGKYLGSCLISRAFTWAYTLEGWDYWEKLSNKWVELHSKILNKHCF